MIYANLSRKNQNEVKQGLEVIAKMKENGDYFNTIKGLMGLMEMFEEDKEFYRLVKNLRDTAKDLWKAQLEKKTRK